MGTGSGCRVLLAIMLRALHLRKEKFSVDMSQDAEAFFSE